MIECSICGTNVKSIKMHYWRMHGEGKNHDPNRGYKDGSRQGWNKGLTKDTDLRVLNNSIKVKESFKNRTPSGYYAPDWHSKPEARAASSRGGGYRENAGRSKKFKVYDSFGNKTTLQSTYEYAVFEILCELEVRWIRPKSLKYDGKNYFADFYLIDFDIYLDPKNDYKAKCDFQKIKAVTEQNNVRLYVLCIEHINKNTIASII